MGSLQGTCVFPGIVLADAVFLAPATAHVSTDFKGEATELSNLEKSLELSRSQIQNIKEWTRQKLGSHEAEIFEAHLMMLEDPEYLEQIQGEIKGKKPASQAIREVTQTFIDVLSQSNSDYLRERVADLRDVSERLIRNLNPQEIDLSSHEDMILIAEDLTPSELMSLVANYSVKGVALEKGGLTSHTAILLKSMGIPSVFGLSSGFEKKARAVAVLDGESGQLILDPDSNTRYEYQKKMASAQALQQELEQWKNKPTRLQDGSSVLMVANVANQKAIEQAVSLGAEGVGLYRTEFFFMDRSKAPTEDEQYENYKKAILAMQGKPLVIRTLDIGGDKEIAYLKLAKEENPFLGVRGLRLCLEHPEIFLPQMRALIRAAEHGPLQVMFPMVTAPEEIEKVFELIPRSPKIKWGMMLEIPSNIFMIPEFSKHVDFFSVGSNDLTQYLTACDRMNSHLKNLSDPFTPGVLRALCHLGREVRKYNRELSVCGEIASDPLLIPYLIGIGVQKLSQNALLIAQNRKLVSQYSMKDCQMLADQVVQLSTREEIVGALQEFKARHN